MKKWKEHFMKLLGGVEDRVLREKGKEVTGEAETRRRK